jgi:hypothetical protein
MRSRFALCLLLFYTSLFLLCASGRLSSADAGAQLQSALLLVSTGRLGIEHPPAGTEHAFRVRGRGGIYYEGHDIGNVALMLPAAWLGSAVSGGPPVARVVSPPILSRVGVALTYAFFCAVGCTALALLFGLWYPQRTAFLLSLVFATATLFWPYAKTAWDVAGGCVGVCLLLYFSTRLFSAPEVRARDLALLGVSLAIAGSFRYSLLPFLALGVAGCLYMMRHRLTPARYLICGAASLALLLPTFAYNWVRMGSPLRPATTAAIYAENNSVGGDVLNGLYGLWLSPNRGLLLFAPIFLLLLTLPWLWRQLSLPARRLTICYGPGALLYILLIASMNHWGAFGWGPRYLVPILPLLFLPVAALMILLWQRYQRLLVTLILLSVALNAAPVFVNWHLACTEFPQAEKPEVSLPLQHAAVWNGLGLGLRGRPLPVPPDVAADPIRRAGARFPDLWTFRLMERSHLGLILGLGITLLLMIAGGVSLGRLLRQESGD